MRVDLEELLVRPDPEYASVDPSYEFVYPLPSGNAFKTVNGAVFYTLNRFCPLQDSTRDEVDGGTVYYLAYKGTIIQLFVLHISEHTAVIRVHQLAPMKERGVDYMWRPRDDRKEVMQGFAAIYAAIHEAIVDNLRYAIRLEETLPPPPPNTDLTAVFIWQELYHPTMTDRELAELINYSHQALKNARNRTGRIKRVPRGKSRGGEHFKTEKRNRR